MCRKIYFFLKHPQSFISSLMLFNVVIIIARPTTRRVNAITQIVKISNRKNEKNVEKEKREMRIDRFSLSSLKLQSDCAINV